MLSSTALVQLPSSSVFGCQPAAAPAPFRLPASAQSPTIEQMSTILPLGGRASDIASLSDSSHSCVTVHISGRLLHRSRPENPVAAWAAALPGGKRC